MSTIAVSGFAATDFRATGTPVVGRRRQAPADRATGGRRHLRLTRRGRLAISAAAAVVAAAGVLSAQSAAAGGGERSVPVVTHTVSGGETLWEIATAVAAPGQDVRDVVAELQELNGLPTSGLRVGQQLLVPAA